MDISTKIENIILVNQRDRRIAVWIDQEGSVHPLQGEEVYFDGPHEGMWVQDTWVVFVSSVKAPYPENNHQGCEIRIKLRDEFLLEIAELNIDRNYR